MAGSGWGSGVSVTGGRIGEAAAIAQTILAADPASPLAELVRQPFRFDFFQAVRLIGLAAAESQAAAAGGRRRWAAAHGPYEEHIRFRAHVGHGFPASAVFSLAVPRAPDAEADAASVPEMTVTFLSLAGTGGIMPAHYTQMLIDRVRDKDFGLRDFLDLFNNRLIAHFYRAWEKCHFYVGYESCRRGDAAATDRFTQMLFSLVGLGTPGLRGRQAIADEVLLYYAGHFSHQPRSAVALQQIVSDMFQVPTEVRQFQGQWMYLRPDDQTQLGAGGNNRLGVSAIAGPRIWGIENKIRVRVRLQRYRSFQAFMPGGPAYVALGHIVRSFVGPSFDFDLQIVLSREAVPRCQLASGGGVQLGWNTWLFSRVATRDVDDAIFACEGMPHH
jgi:type VI secretion system protein ImpH